MTIETLLTFVSTAAAATWVIASKLGKIESAIKGHVATDEVVHAEQNAKILKLEKRRRL